MRQVGVPRLVTTAALTVLSKGVLHEEGGVLAMLSAN